VGFQILDDVKNLKTGVPGKKRGDDIVEGKKSLPMLLYMHRYPEKKDMVFHTFIAAREKGTLAPEVEELILALTQSGVLDEAEEKGVNFIARTREIFTSLAQACSAPNNESRTLLAGLTQLIS
jgi:octaprenyl-diphosphate synthase